MTPRLARIVTRLYPRAWRDRYGEEFAAMLELHPGGWRVFADSFVLAVRERVFPTQGGSMAGNSNSFVGMMRRPSAFIPVGMSMLALGFVLSAVAYGMAHPSPRDKDEGAIAHIWQLLMTVQVPIVVFFLLKWARRAPRPGLGVLALQAGVWLASCAPVYFLHL